MLEENVVNATVEEVVPPHESTEEVETQEADLSASESESVEVAPAADEKPKQSAEDNAKFAEIRRKHEEELKKASKSAVDKFIDSKFGKEYGIHTVEEYENALAKQNQEKLLKNLQDGETDPMEIYQKLKENDPEFKAMKRSQQEAYHNSQIKELNNELKSLDIDIVVNDLNDVAKLTNSEEIIKHLDNGKTLSEAYFLANKNSIIELKAKKVQEDTLRKAEALQGANPGALKANGDEKQQSIFSLSKEDFKKMQEDVLMGRRK